MAAISVSFRISMFTASQTQDSHAALVALQNELGRFVIEEHAVQREAMRRLWSRPVDERVEEGRCIADLRVTGEPAAGVWALECAGNDSRFREGDIVQLNRGNPQEPFMEGVIRSIGDHGVEVLKRRDLGADRCAVGETGLCLDESFVDLEHTYRGAIEDLGKTAVGRDVILPLLRGDARTTVDAAQFDEAFSSAEADGLDDRQAQAVANAIAANPCWLIQGPPGTGKTHVLAWVIVDLLRRGERILVTSFTHRAINNLLAAVAERAPESRRIGKVAPFIDATLPATVEQRESRRDFAFAHDSAGGGYVIGATPFALRSARLGGTDFDTIVIDEASQVTVPLAVMAMLAGRKYILAGDHQQLPPVTLSRPPREAKAMSIFGRLVGRGYDTMLTTTRRLNESLCRWPSDTFYRSKLRSDPAAAARRLALSPVPAFWAEAFDPAASVIWLAVPHHGCRSCAPEEATLIADLLRVMHQGGLRWQEIGVVVPFRRQARYVRRRLAARQPDRVSPAALTIDTVERMQGQEREVVVVSFTTSDEDFALRLKDFLFLPQRINVAATRPRTKLFIVASPDLLKLARGRTDDDEMACFASLLESARRIDIALPGTNHA